MIIRIFLLCLISITSFAQEETKVKDLDLTISLPKLDKNLPYSSQGKLQQKVIAIFTQNDIVNRKGSTFEVHTYLNLIDFGKLEGITKEETVQLELNMIIKNVFTEQDFLFFNQKLSGSGKTRKAAVNRAISSIRPSRSVYTNFIKDSKEKIDRYYQEECQSIIADAQTAIQNNEYQKAIALLYSVPKKSDCRTANQTLLNQTYTQFQTQNCQSFIQKAEAAVLQKNYKDAINLLAKVDPNSPCKENAKQLLTGVTQKVDEQTAKKMDFLNKVYKDNVELEKARQQSMKSISNTYIEGIKKD